MSNGPRGKEDPRSALPASCLSRRSRAAFCSSPSADCRTCPPPRTDTADFVQHLDSQPTLDDFLGNVALSKTNASGATIGPETQSAWLRPYPPGLRKLIVWISRRYGRPIIYVTENGTSVKDESDLPPASILEDDFRVKYFEGYLHALAEAYSFDNVDVRGYMAWSLME